MTDKNTSKELLEGNDVLDDDGENRRRYARRSVLWPATLSVGKHNFSCHVWNMSLGGARIRVDIPLKNNTEVILDIPERGRIPGIVVWAGAESMGIDFTIPRSRIEKMFGDRLHVLGLHKL